jgi:histidine triad (HIT) family protein
MDIQPINPGHALVIPNRHAGSLGEVDEHTAGHLFRLAQRVMVALRSSDLRCEGVNLLLADGAAAGQEVFHTHLHVIPRYPGDGFGFRFGSSYSVKPTRRELDEAAERIRRVFEEATVPPA